MLLGDIPRVLARRWYVVLFGVLASAGLVYGVLSAVPPTYAVKSEVLLLPPASVVPAGGNPYLALGGLESIGSVASKTMTDDRTNRLVRSQFGKLDYGVALDPTAAAPMVLVEVESPDPARSQAAEKFLSDRLPGVLVQLQDAAEVPRTSRITSTSVIQADLPVVHRTAQVRAAVVAGALGVGLTVLAAAGIDVLAARRRLRSDDGPASSSSGEDPRSREEPRHESTKGRPSSKLPAPPQAEDLIRVSG